MEENTNEKVLDYDGLSYYHENLRNELDDIQANLNTKQNIVQVRTLPSASATFLNSIYQYIGNTSGGFTKGYYYTCVATSSGGSVTYSWEQLNVQPGEDLPVYYINLHNPQTADIALLRDIKSKLPENGENDFMRRCIVIDTSTYSIENESSKLLFISSNNSFSWGLNSLIYVKEDPTRVDHTHLWVNRQQQYFIYKSDDTVHPQFNYGDVHVLETDLDYSTPYVPLYNGSPATKKYVDDSIAAIPTPTIETATDEDIDDLFPTPPVEYLAIDLTDTSLWIFDSDCFYCSDASEISRITNALSGQSTLSGEITYEDTTNVTYQGNYVFYNDAYTFVSSDGMSRFTFNLSEHEIAATPVEYLNFDLTNENVWSSVGSEYVCIDEDMPAEVFTKLQDHYTYPTTITYSPESDVTRTCIGNIFNYQVFVDSDGKCKFNVYSDSENLTVSDINNLYINLGSNIYTEDSNVYTTTDADEWSKMTLYYNYLQYGAFTSQVYDKELSQDYTCDSYMGSELNTFNCRNLDRTPGNHDYLVSLDSSTHEVRVLLIGVE